MLHTKMSKFVLAVLLIAVGFTACKKDPFTEKDAIAAQSTLLQQMYSYQIQIAQISAAASRSSDSAKIAIQVLVNSGATSLAILQAQQNLAYLMQSYQNQLAMYKYQDSLGKVDAANSNNLSIAYQKFYDSLTAARTSITTLNNLKKNYTFKVTDLVSGATITGATVSAFSYTSNSILTATTDANGVATFTQAILDPTAYYYVNLTGYAFTTAQISSATSFAPKLWNTANANNTVAGQIVADIDLTNGDATEGVAGQLVTFTVTNSGNGLIYQFPVTSDANGNYSIKLPDAASNYTATTASSITVSQKMFVHYMQGQNVNTTTPHIDSVSTILSVGAPAFINTYFGQNYYGPNNFSGVPNQTQTAYYFSLPNDANGKQVWFSTFATNPTYGSASNILSFTTNTSGNSNPALYSDIVATVPSSPLGIDNFISGVFGISADPNYTYLPVGGTAPTTVPVTLVDLSGKIITSAPSLVANVNASGKVTSIVIAPGATSGGAFARRTATGRLLDQNQFGLRTQAFYTATASSSSVTLSVQGSVTKTLNFDYPNLSSRNNTAN